MQRRISSFIVLLSLCTGANAQDLKIPNPSTTQRLDQELGLGQITVTYSRPNTKGRKIFDGMEPYGMVWRTGANSATRIKLTDTFQVEGHTVVPGEYGFFTIPGPKEWTVIFNKTANQWGAYSYDSTKDVLRFTVKAARLDKKLETFTIQFTDAFADHCDMQLQWENTSVAIHFATDVDKRVMANIEQAMKVEKKPYYQAAIYYYNHDKDMNVALRWIKEFEKANPTADNAKYWKAKIQVKMGDKQGAIQSANEGLKLAVGDVEYTRLNKEVLADANKL